jgi:hypothetical protein
MQQKSAQTQKKANTRPTQAGCNWTDMVVVKMKEGKPKKEAQTD